MKHAWIFISLQLKKIRVGHDNFGHRPEWNLKQITIDVPQRNEHYTFLYNNWIAGEDVYLEPGMMLNIFNFHYCFGAHHYFVANFSLLNCLFLSELLVST